VLFRSCYNELFAQVPFDSSRFLLWSVDYSLLSGKYPKFMLKDKYSTYINEYLSVFQGYPDIPGFRSLVQADLLPKSEIAAGVQNSTLANSYTVFSPQLEINDTRPKQFTLHQDSENAGMFSLSAFNVMEFPDAWQNLMLVPADNRIIYNGGEKYSFRELLPSLWRVDMITSGKSLLKLNNGYDTGWKAYTSVWGLITGLNPVEVHQKCDGVANCFEIPGSGVETVYLFYTPERLSFLGWVLTVTGIILALKSRARFFKLQ
jgi:hypothetical protein